MSVLALPYKDRQLFCKRLRCNQLVKWVFLVTNLNSPATYVTMYMICTFKTTKCIRIVDYEKSILLYHSHVDCGHPLFRIFRNR